MNRAFSLYLDIVRFCAACLVYVYHSNQRWLVADPLPLSNFGHSSVIVFFVLSGFVIAYVTDTKEREWVSYSASRLSRVYSVVLPTLLLTLLLDAVGRQLNPEIYSYPFDQIVVRLLGSVLMVNELWSVSITSFSNVPYWSITYEFWYYVLFGVLMFLPRSIAWTVAGLIALLLGPKVLLLAPIWCAGVLLYRWRRLEAVPLWLGYALALGSAAGIVGTHAIGLYEHIHAWFADWAGPKLYRELTFSKFFVADYLLCLLVFANFAGMRRLCSDLALRAESLERAVRFVAGFTFTLYLLHQPLFLFWGAVLKGKTGTLASWMLVTVLTFGSVWLIGQVTENKRHLLKDWIACRLRLLPWQRPRARERGG